MRQVTLIWGGVVFMMLLLMSGCVREAYNISWKGVVVDETTGKPVKHARILASSSYQANIDETEALKNYTLSDEYGRFRMSFRRGFGITVRTSASGFLSGLDYKVVKKPDISDTIFLSPYPFNASLVVRKMDEGAFSASIPFIRDKHIVAGSGSDAGSLMKWGFDFLEGTNTLNLDSADIWIEVNPKNGKMVLNASPKGGVFPVLQTENSDFITSVTKAPESGYLKSYVLTGEEAGFFVLCRNGVNVAKMIPEDKICILSYEQPDGSKVKETGIRFDYLFQPDLQNRFYFPVSASAEMSGLPEDRSPVDLEFQESGLD
ncbi:hypothetical protein BY457_11369 [Marinilabilia salmonicolor]|jgi:hypothetical protein|uniref:hypothetical protein n=1 Tax=Marinilabilia salmonicolor TaxID=989 RepID=UPI000D06727D|nr:hypothetical protein [Marinilabilia salmonicolor]PRY96996.1 hypothetical protein BY457_11369 [Marinilabilia salmonicolor]